MSRPALSVVMAVRDAEPWVRAAVESILTQTYRDFELIVVDDGSADETAKILAGFDDPRLRVVSQPGVGLTRSLNRAIDMSHAPLVARMDADDVALPERFARQAAVLDANPEIGLLGTACEEITPAGEVVATVVPPLEDAEIRRALIRRNPFVHSSIMVRRAVIERAGRYDERLRVAQDYDLWLRISQLTRMANLPEPLVQRRLTPGRVSSARDTERLRTEVIVKFRALRNGAYPPWYAIFLVKPLCALALPPEVRRLARRVLSRERFDHDPLRSG